LRSNTRSMKKYLFTNLEYVYLLHLSATAKKKNSELSIRSLLGNLQETRVLRHFAATRSVKRSEASSLASGVCRLPFRRPRSSSRRPFTHAAASLNPPGYPLWPLRVHHRAFHPARLRRAAPSRVALHLAPFPSSFSVPSPAATSRHSARTAALKYPPSPCAPHSIPSHPIPSDRPTPVHTLADISRRWMGNY